MLDRRRAPELAQAVQSDDAGGAALSLDGEVEGLNLSLELSQGGLQAFIDWFVSNPKQLIIVIGFLAFIYVVHTIGKVAMNGQKLQYNGQREKTRGEIQHPLPLEPEDRED